MLGGPDLVLPHVHADAGVVVQPVAQGAHEPGGSDAPGGGGGEGGGLAGPEGVQLSQPVAAVGLGGMGEKLPQDDLYVAYHRDGGGEVLADLRRVHVQMDSLGAPGHLFGGGDGPVGGPGPGDDEQVGGIESPVGGGGAEGADHTQVHGVIGGQQT